MKLAAIILLAGLSLASAAPPPLVVSDRDVVELNGRRYVALDALGESVTIQSNTPRRVTATAHAITVVVPANEPIFGTLTWSAGMSQGNPPDFGGKVWLVKDDEVAALAKEAGGTTTEPIPARATGWAARLDMMFPHVTVDGNGRFAFTEVAAGPYTLIYVSKRAKGPTERDRGGKMRFQAITVEPGKPVDASLDFGVTAY